MKRLIFIFTVLFLCLANLVAQPVIDPELEAEMQLIGNEEQIEVVVLMKAQYDRSQLCRRANYYPSRAERRAFVVKELKTFTEASQHDLKSILAEMESHGLVSSVRSLWSANALYFEATKSALLDLSERTDIGTISLNIQHQWIPDGETQEPASATREVTPNITQVNADQVREMGYTGAGVVVAVVDSGVNYNHLDLADHLWDGGEAFPHHGYGAVNYNDVAADLTSRGPVTWQNTEFGDYAYNPGIGLIRPDVCAPGVNIKSLDYNNTSGYTNMDGTSQATPCVAGIVALMLQKNPELTPAEICRILEETSVKLTPTKSNTTGLGRVDALDAVNAVEAYDGINDQTLEAEVFPNPSSGSFTIVCEGLKRVSVYSVDGRLVKNQSAKGSECMIEGLESGVYLVRIETDKETFVRKIVKM